MINEIIYFNKRLKMFEPDFVGQERNKSTEKCCFKYYEN